MPTLKRNLAGQALIDSVNADLAARGLKLGPDEAALLEMAADAVDDIKAMRRRVIDDGRVVVNSKSGAIKAHPLLPIIATRAAQLDRLLARLTKVLAEPEEAQTPLQAAKSNARVRAGQRSAQSRAAQGIKT